MKYDWLIIIIIMSAPDGIQTSSLPANYFIFSYQKYRLRLHLKLALRKQQKKVLILIRLVNPHQYSDCKRNIITQDRLELLKP